MVMAHATVKWFNATKETVDAMAPVAVYAVSEKVSLVSAGGVANKFVKEMKNCLESPRIVPIKSDIVGEVTIFAVGMICFADG
jgi:hypothetical protein